MLRACQVEEGKVVQRKSSVLNIKLEVCDAQLSSVQFAEFPCNSLLCFTLEACYAQLDRLHLFGAPPLTVEHMEVRYSNAQKAVQKQEAVALEARKTLDELREMFPEVDLAVSMVCLHPPGPKQCLCAPSHGSLPLVFHVKAFFCGGP